MTANVDLITLILGQSTSIETSTPVDEEDLDWLVEELELADS